MSVDVAIDPRPSYLYAEVSGTFDLAAAVDAFREVLDAAARHGLDRILVDVRPLGGDMSTMERFGIAEAVAAEIARRSMFAVVMAIVGNPPMVDSTRFGEDVAVNRGAKIRAVTDVDEAFQWLGLPPADPHVERPSGD
jgi:hypothetical protein